MKFIWYGKKALWFRKRAKLIFSDGTVIGLKDQHYFVERATPDEEKLMKKKECRWYC